MSISKMSISIADAPKNIVVFIRDQVKPEDLWFPRDWAKEHLPNQQWLKDNGLSFSNAFTNSAMCTAARASFFTGKFPAQHEVGLVLSDIQNPILDKQPQLSTDLPNLATVLKGQGYDVSFIGKAHLSKTFTRQDGELVYQDMKSYGFDDWQGPDAGQDMEIENAGGGYANHDQRYTDQAIKWLSDRAATGNSKPFCLVVSLINPHDVLAYPKEYKDFGYDESWLQGDIKDLPPTVTEILKNNFKPSVQSQWKLVQQFGQPMQNDQQRLEYLNFYGNLLKDVDKKMGDIITILGKTKDPSKASSLLQNTMIVSTADHGEMGLSHGGLVQKMEVAYDEALKVPLVWSNPQYFKGGQETNAMVSHVDFLQTLSGYLGFDPAYVASQDLRGVDYSELLRYAHHNADMNGAPEPQESILFTFDDIYAGQDPALIVNGSVEHGLFPAANRIQAVRTKDFKYARYYSGDKEYTPRNWEGELYDLRPIGGDYYPDRDPLTGQLNPFKGAPLELKNFDPKTGGDRRRFEGLLPSSGRAQRAIYLQMANLLNQQIDSRLDPLPEPKAKAPEVFAYPGGSFNGAIYSVGQRISRLLPSSSGQDLELAFTTQSNQIYNVVYKNSDGSYTTLASNIIGTNGPVYQYLSGLPASVELADVSIQWQNGYQSIIEDPINRNS
jgi:arylsulfatase A-like enzyme